MPLRQPTFLSLLFLLCFSFLWVCPIGAQTSTKYKSLSRLTVAPAIYPYYPLQANFTNRSGEQVITSEATGLEGFLRFSTYKPGGGFNIGLDLGYFQHSYALNAAQDVLDNGSLSLTGGIIGPHISYALKNIERVRHLKLNAGLSHRLYFDRVIRSNQTLVDGRTIPSINRNLPYFRTGATYVQLGLGMLIERPSIREQKTYPATLQLQAFLPFFNQSRLVKDDPALFPAGEQTFRDLRFNSVHLGILYAQALDIPSNNRQSISNKQTDLLATYNKQFGFAPPVVNYDWPNKRVEGVFTLTAVHQAGRDSLQIGIDSTYFNLGSSVGIKAAYTIHALGNARGIFNPNTGQPYYSKWFLYNAFLTGGVQQQSYRLSNEAGYFSSQRVFGYGEIGARFGAVLESKNEDGLKLVLLANVGIGNRFVLLENGIYADGDEQILRTNAQYVFAGLQIGDLISVRLSTSPLKVATSQGGFFAGSNLEVGFGF